jgi:hypothetical protein
VWQLLKVAFFLFLCTSLSLRLLCAVLVRPVLFSVPHLLLALYDSVDFLYHRLGLSALVATLQSASTRPSLFSSLSSYFPDLQTSSPSSSSWSSIDAVSIAALHPLTRLISLMQRRTERARRRRMEVRHLLLQPEGGERVLEEEMARDVANEEVKRELEEASEWVQVAGGLLEGAADDRSRLLDPYLVPLLSAVLELRAAMEEWEEVVEAEWAPVTAPTWKALKAAVAEATERMGRGLKGRMTELELPAKHRESIEALQRGTVDKGNEEKKQ